jgi:DNA-directed RNA polymerase II subunit RPB2
MERDCMIAHGMAQFLKERLLETSDKYCVHVCNNCGLFATKMKNKPIFTCYNEDCRNKTRVSVSKVFLPYAFKLLIQELMAINILPRIRTEMSFKD